MNKKKLFGIIGLLILVIAIVFAIIFVVNKANENNNEEMLNNGVPNTGLEVTGKLEEYITRLGNKYYIKYSGKFKNNSGELVQAVVEYTKSGADFALRSSEIDMHLICREDSISSVSNRYKMVIKMSKNTVDVSEYNLVSDLGQDFVSEYKEKVNNTEYDVEEYIYDGKTLKYYFSGSDIKLIRYNGEDIRIVRLEFIANTEVLAIPEGYKVIDNTQVSTTE